MQRAETSTAGAGGLTAKDDPRGVEGARIFRNGLLKCLKVGGRHPVITGHAFGDLPRGATGGLSEGGEVDEKHDDPFLFVGTLYSMPELCVASLVQSGTE
jgi:hypothetical protein